MASADAQSRTHLPKMRPRKPEEPEGTARTDLAATKSYTSIPSQCTSYDPSSSRPWTTAFHHFSSHSASTSSPTAKAWRACDSFCFFGAGGEVERLLEVLELAGA